jgi:thymidylate synthase (FAD)
MSEVTIVTEDPAVVFLGEMRLNEAGVLEMAKWVQSHRPDCVPSEGFNTMYDLLPHGPVESTVVRRHGFDDLGNDTGEIEEIAEDRVLSDNELLVEIAGRKCYDSFAEKAGRKTNKDYIAHTQSGTVKHASILYHAKISFFLAGISRRVSHELIRNYVGADREEEGSPSQESTRFTHHYGWYIAHPRDLDNTVELELFRKEMQLNYDFYTSYIERQTSDYITKHGKKPFGLERKRIFESAAQRLDHACETSFIWTTNPMALRKLFLERGDEAADLEFQRLVKVWKPICLARWPNLFQGV